MDSFEINKILGAVLATCLVLLSLNIAAGALFAPTKPAKPGYLIEVHEAQPGGQTAQPETPPVPIETLLANADVKRGEAAAKKCVACHSFAKDGKNLIGPHLWGVVNRPKHSISDFNYTAAMKSQTGNWTLEQLNIYLKNPRAMVPGTAMSAFPGLPKDSERADVIAYLNSLSDNPAPLPKAPPAAPAGGAGGNPPAGNAPAGNAPTAQPPKPQQPAKPQ